MDARIPVVALLAVAALAAAVVPQLDSKVPLSTHPSEADRVVLYQNGIAAIGLDRHFTSSGGTTRLTFTVPATTILDSIRLEGDGVQVREFRTSLAPRDVVQPGDRVTVHVEGKSFSGSVLSLRDGLLLLAHGNDTVAIRQEQVKALEVHGALRSDAPAGSASVEAVVVASAGNRTVHLSYLAQGAGWTPSYIVDAATGATTLHATLTALADWKDIRLELVAGQPSMVYEKPRFHTDEFSFDMRSAGVALSDAAYETSFSGSEALGDLHRYKYGGTVSMQRDELVRLPLLVGRLQVLRHYYDAAVGPYETVQAMQELYQVRNTFTDPLPSGTVRLFLGADWIASDTMPQLAPGEQGNLTAGVSSEVKLTVRHPQHDQKVLEGPACVVEGCARGRIRDTDGFTLSARNAKDESIDLRVRFTPQHDAIVKETEPRPDERHGSELVWNVHVPAGKTQEFRVTTERTYTV